MSRRLAAVLALVAGVALAGCGADDPDHVAVSGHDGAEKSSAAVRAERRAYDGAPPVIPHDPFGADCRECHTAKGMAVEGVGFAPPSPHEETEGMSAMSRCTQCHVFSRTDEIWRANSFAGLQQDLRKGSRFGAGAPPVIPHKTFMRENCLACHSGPAAREEIRTSHPERVRCQQCHVPRATTDAFSR